MEENIRRKVKDTEKCKLATVGSVHWLAVKDSEGGTFAFSSSTDVPWYIHDPVQETSSYPPVASLAPALPSGMVIVEIKTATCLGKCQINTTGVPYSSRALCPASRCRGWGTFLGADPLSGQKQGCSSPGRCFQEALDEPFVLWMERIPPCRDCTLDPQQDLRTGVLIIQL